MEPAALLTYVAPGVGGVPSSSSHALLAALLLLWGLSYFILTMLLSAHGRKLKLGPWGLVLPVVPIYVFVVGGPAMCVLSLMVYAPVGLATICLLLSSPFRVGAALLAPDWSPPMGLQMIRGAHS